MAEEATEESVQPDLPSPSETAAPVLQLESSPPASDDADTHMHLCSHDGQPGPTVESAQTTLVTMYTTSFPPSS